MADTELLQAPFPYFGGKSSVADLVWSRLGDVDSYIEPFYGSGAVMLLRPHAPRVETVNDKCAYIANFWRAAQREPDAVADLMTWPVNEVDLEARHKWLVTAARKREHAERMRDDPDYFDAKIAAWWCWGLCQWIGGGWCEGEWRGRGDENNKGGGINIRDESKGGKLPHISGKGYGVHRKRPHISNKGRGVHRQRPHISSKGLGVHRMVAGESVADRRAWLREWMRALQDRLMRVRVCCGDWKRVVSTEKLLTNFGTCGVFLDPPYSAEAGREMGIYREDCGAVAHEVREWCKQYTDHPEIRIALCGYEGEHNELEAMGWSVDAWKASGGMANITVGDAAGKANCRRERIWFNPACEIGGKLF